MTANIKYPNDSVKQAAFENACDDIYYGCNRGYWKRNNHNVGLPDEESNEVWHEAFVYMSNQNENCKIKEFKVIKYDKDE